MKVQLLERIIKGCRYLDVYGKIWEGRYNEKANEVQLWRQDTGFGLWANGENIIKRIV